MAECGKVCKISDSHFIWKIPFSTFRSFYEYFNSPKFQYMEETLYLQTDHLNERGFEFLTFRIYCKGTKANPFNVSYRMCIKDTMGVDYWSWSEDANCFSDENPNILHSDLLNNACRIAPGNVLPFHLTFCSSAEEPTAVQEDLNLMEANSSSSNADNSCNCSCQICSCSSEDSDELLQNFKDLLLKGQKSDVTFKVKGTELKAHKAILMARSPVFEKMFDHDMLEKTSGTVEITDCEPEYFQAFLLYLYTGKLEKPTVKKTVELYCLADKYNIPVLCSSCIRFLLRNVSVESFGDVVSLGLRHCEPELVSSVNTFFSHNMKDIIRTDKWKSFIIENPAEANELLIKALS